MNNGRTAAFAAVLILVAVSSAVLCLGTDSEASSTPTDLIYMDSASENITPSNPAVITYNGSPAIELYIASNLSDGDYGKVWNNSLYLRFVSDDLKGYNIYTYDTYYFNDGSNDTFNGSNMLNRSNESWYTSAYTSVTPLTLTMDSGVNRIVMHAYVNDDSGYPPSRLSGTNEVTFDFRLERVDGNEFVTTVSYDANGGSGGPTSGFTKTDYGESSSGRTVSVELSSVQPTRQGYDFTGWNTASSGNGTHYDAGQTISVAMGTDMRLYAEWQVQAHDMTLYTTDDSDPWRTVSVQHGQTLSVEDPPAPEGKLFAGWFVDNTRTTPFDPATPITSDRAVYAGFVDELSFITTPDAQETVTPVDPQGTFVFSSMASEGAATVLWEFPDGTTSTDKTVTHWFGPGTYSVKLTVWNSFGEASTKEIHLTVEEEGDGESGVLIYVAVGIVAVIAAAIILRRFL